MKTYQRHRDAEWRIQSARRVIEVLLPLDIYPRMKRRLISHCLWQITEAEGRHKYDLRYRSQESLIASREELRHEHVRRRKDMVDALLNSPPDVEIIVAEAVGCVVTKGEHAKLAEIDRNHKTLNGWSRYRKAGIVVVDMVTGTPLQFA